jgi:hypothetical protein
MAFAAFVLFGCIRPAQSAAQKPKEVEAVWEPSEPPEIPSRPASGSATFPLDGTWQGSLKIVHRDREPPEAPESLDLRITIRGSSAMLHAGNGTQWSVIYPGKLRLETHEESAILKVMDHGRDRDGKWVKTQNVSVTLSSPNVLRAIYVRLVNNVQLPEDNDDADWWTVAVGDLNRVSPESG